MHPHCHFDGGIFFYIATDNFCYTLVIMQNYFQATKESPYHISVGALVRNNEGDICAHYFPLFDHPGMPRMEDFYILMRETIEPNETIEDCLKRGLMEEFGVDAILQRYVGSIASHFTQEGVRYEKTTLYFLCNLVSIDETKRTGDIESKSELRWMKPEVLIEKMKEQGVRIGREDIDESAVLLRL
jgi:hypothetical protein